MDILACNERISVGDGRNWLQKWWSQKTYHPSVGESDEEMVARVGVKLSLLDRLFVLFGREVSLLVVSEKEKVDKAMESEVGYTLIDGLRTYAWTTPKRYGG